jgi:glycosyltransferase involved in cell wall biosynthesis
LKNVLYVEGCRDGTVGGSHTCLLRTIQNLDSSRFHPIVVFYDDHVIAEALRDAGADVHILENRHPVDWSAGLARRWPRLAALAVLIRPVQQAFNFSWHFALPVFNCYRLIRRWGADIVHLNNSINTNHEWMVAARIAGVPVVSHERGISGRLTWTARALGRVIDKVVCVSKVIQESLVRQGLDQTKILVIYDGIDLSHMQIRHPAQVIRSRHHIPPDAPVIGAVGNIKAWKGQEIIVRAAAILKSRWPDMRTLLVGTVADHVYKARLDSIISESGLTDRVIFTGFQKDPWDYLNVMDIVIHSSVEPEPFGMVNLEAMSMRRPVISTTIGGPAEVFANSVDGFLVDPGDPDALAKRVAELLDDPQTRHAIAEAGYRTVRSRFHISQTLEQIHDIYDSLPQRSRSVAQAP